MSFSISLTIDEKQITGILAIGHILTAETKHAIRSNLSAALYAVVEKLLFISAVAPEEIKSIRITADFSRLFAGHRLPQRKIGYIRYLPRITGNLPPLAQSPLKKSVVTTTVDSQNSFSNALNNLKNEQVSALAINPSFFSWTTFTGTEIYPLVYDIFGSRILVSLGSAFNKIGYTARENLLLVNTLLLPDVRLFFDQLKQALLALKIKAKILTLRNNGMLLSESTIRKFPIYTIGALFSAQLMALAYQEPFANAVVITQKHGTIYLGIIENRLPLLSLAPFDFHFITLNLSHPFTRSIPVPKNLNDISFQEAIKDTLTTMNPSENSLVVVITEVEESLKNFLLTVCQKLYLPVIETNVITGTGALVAPVCIEQEHYIPNYTGEKRRKIKNLLWENLRKEASEEGLFINDEWQTFWEERPIRYLPEQAALVRLGYYGPS